MCRAPLTQPVKALPEPWGCRVTAFLSPETQQLLLGERPQLMQEAAVREGRMMPKSQAAQLAASGELPSGPAALSLSRTPPCCRKTASGALSLLVSEQLIQGMLRVLPLLFPWPLGSGLATWPIAPERGFGLALGQSRGKCLWQEGKSILALS